MSGWGVQGDVVADDECVCDEFGQVYVESVGDLDERFALVGPERVGGRDPVRNCSPASNTSLGWEGPGGLGRSSGLGFKAVVLVAQGSHDDDALGGSEPLDLRVEC